MTSPTTEVVDLGALPVPGGYFVNRADAPGRTPFSPSAEDAGGLRHSFTYKGGGSTTRADVLRLIDGAQQKVFVASFFIGDAEVREALCRAAERLRGGVYLISAMSENDLRRAINEVGEEWEVDTKIERKRFEELTKHGIAVRAYEGCHAKFVVVDDRAALVSSANLTTAGLDTTGENGVVIEDPAFAERIARFFAALWHGSRWEMALTGEPVVGTRTVGGSEVRLPPPDQDAVGPIWTLQKAHRHIKDAIARLIGSARTELLLATFSLEGMCKRPDLLLDHVRDAVERGVTVRMLLRGRNHLSSHTEDAAALADLGVELYPCRLNHAKGVIADRVRGALFSANFDASHGLDRDVELGMRLDGTPALAEALRYFEHAISERDLDYVRNPPASDLATGLPRHLLSRWPLPAIVDVELDDVAWTELVRLEEGPVMFTGGPSDLCLHAGRQSWRFGGDGQHRLARDEGVGTYEIPSLTAAELLAERLTARSDAGGDRLPSGLCAATLRRVST